MKQKILLVVLDGLGDRPEEQHNGLTALEAARTPYLNFLAEKGACGLVDVEGIGVRPGSDTGHLSLFGYDPKKIYAPRGTLEAAGLGVVVRAGQLAFRVNVATVDLKGRVVDRRAGRISDCSVFEPALSKIKVGKTQFLFKAGVEHRGVLVVTGAGLSPNVSSNDARVQGEKELEVRPTDGSPQAEATAAIMNKYLKQAKKVLAAHGANKKRKAKKELPGNALLLRGAGGAVLLPSFQSRYEMRAACVAGSVLEKGIARALGMQVINVPGATGRKDTNVLAKFLAAKTALQKNEFVFVHVKGTDIYGHDGDSAGKKAFIERIDAGAKELLSMENTVVCVTADHSTPCQLKNHSGDAVPILFYGKGVRRDATKKFGERECAAGGVGRLRGLDVMNELLNLAGRAPLAGA